MVGNTLEARNLWLEGDLIDKSDKQKRCYKHLAALRKERDSVKKEMEEAKNALKLTSDAMVKAEESVKILTKEHDDAKAAQVSAEGEVEKEKLWVRELKGTVSDLRTKIKDWESKAIALEDAKEKAERSVRSVASQALDIAKDQFKNVVAQILFLHPELVVDLQIVNEDHVLQDGQIVKPPITEGGETAVIVNRS